MTEIVVVGGSFAGLAAALELRNLLPDEANITLVSNQHRFMFMPSLIWIMQGWREPEDISFAIKPVLDEAGINFKHAAMESIDPDAGTITLSFGETLSYDKLLIATGGQWDWDSVPGSRPKPEGNTVSILSLADAMNAQSYWQAFLDDPGPIVIGIALNTSLFGAAYELALNLDMALRQEGKRDAAEITFVTPEPYLGHFGMDGIGDSRAVIEAAFSHRDILYKAEEQISRVEPTMLVADPHHHYKSDFTILIPPYRGIKPIREAEGLANEKGFIEVDEYQRSTTNENIYAAGVAAKFPTQSASLLPIGRFTPGTVSAELGRIAAHNIAADLGHAERVTRTDESLKGFYVMDTATDGLMLSLGPQSWLNLQLRVPGPWSHWAKSMTERYQMWQVQTGKY